jgi:hypothetical protein
MEQAEPETSASTLVAAYVRAPLRACELDELWELYSSPDSWLTNRQQGAVGAAHAMLAAAVNRAERARARGAVAVAGAALVGHQVRLDGARLAGAGLSSARLHGVSLVGADLSNATWPRPSRRSPGLRVDAEDACPSPNPTRCEATKVAPDTVRTVAHGAARRARLGDAGCPRYPALLRALARPGPRSARARRVSRPPTSHPRAVRAVAQAELRSPGARAWRASARTRAVLPPRGSITPRERALDTIRSLMSEHNISVEDLQCAPRVEGSATPSDTKTIAVVD